MWDDGRMAIHGVGWENGRTGCGIKGEWPYRVWGDGIMAIKGVGWWPYRELGVMMTTENSVMEMSANQGGKVWWRRRG